MKTDIAEPWSKMFEFMVGLITQIYMKYCDRHWTSLMGRQATRQIGKRSDRWRWPRQNPPVRVGRGTDYSVQERFCTSVPSDPGKSTSEVRPLSVLWRDVRVEINTTHHGLLMVGAMYTWGTAGRTIASNRLHIAGLVRERRNPSALAMELRLSCTSPAICSLFDSI